MASLRKRGRVWYFSFINQDGRKIERKGCPDKRVTEELARAAESEAAKIKAGVIDLKELAYLAQGARPLAEHLVMNSRATCEPWEAGSMRWSRRTAPAASSPWPAPRRFAT